MRKTYRIPNALLLAAGLLVLLLSSCTGEEPLPSVSLPQSLPQSMKGYELYSWKAGQVWRFTLITGTNRLKTLAEITSRDSVVEDGLVKITVEGVPDLKATLNRLPPSAQVIWWGERDLPSGSLIPRARLELPPRQLVEQVQSHCSELGIWLEMNHFATPSGTNQPVVTELGTPVPTSISAPTATMTPGLAAIPDPTAMCPGGPPLYSFATAQRFQHGLMIWLEALDEFYILFDTDQHLSDSAQGYSSLKSLRIVRGPLELKPGASPDNRVKETPPPGYIEPVSGFGLVWRGEVTGTDDIRETLGWAEGPEYGFDTVYQCQASCDAHWNCYLRGPDGKMLHLYYLMHFGHYWEQWSGTPTPPPTPSPATEAPKATAAPPGPAIVSFNVAPLEVDPGDTVTLTWEARGDGATLCPTARFVLFSRDDCRQVPLSGSTTFVIPLEAAGFQHIDFLLEVETLAPPVTVAAQASVAFKCDAMWFFSDTPQAGICPREPIRSHAAVQHFERGTMIWLEKLGCYFILEDTLLHAGDVKKQIDIVNDPLEITRDTSLEIVPPPGRYAPQSGLGLVWRGDVKESPGYRERLGWALEPEFGYQAVFQCDDALPSGGRSWQTCYLEGPDGEVIVLHPLGGWYLIN